MKCQASFFLRVQQSRINIKLECVTYSQFHDSRFLLASFPAKRNPTLNVRAEMHCFQHKFIHTHTRTHTHTYSNSNAGNKYSAKSTAARMYVCICICMYVHVCMYTRRGLIAGRVPSTDTHAYIHKQTQIGWESHDSFML